MKQAETKFWYFRQNNSRGSFDVNDEKGIGPCVWVEAEDYELACIIRDNLTN